MDNNIKSERLQLKLTKDQKHKLRILASIKNMSISNYILQMIEQDLEKNSIVESLINNQYVATTVKEDIKKKIKLEYTYDNKDWNIKQFNSKNTIDTFLKKNKNIKNHRIIE